MMSISRFLLLILLFVEVLPTAAAAQENAPAVAPLEAFIVQVARRWAAADAVALVELAPADGRIMLDVGGETVGPVQVRHAAAALRALFAGREHVSIRPTRVTVAGGQPLRGFGEMSWASRSRGVSAPQTVTLYVGTVWEGDGWRIRELRLLR